MTKHSAVVYFIPFLALFVAEPLVTSAEAPGNPAAETGTHIEKPESEYPDPIEQFLRFAPASAIRKLKDATTMARGAAELTRYFATSAVRKWVVVHTKVEDVDPTPDRRNAARLLAQSVPVKWDGGSMARLSWLYFPTANAPAAESVKVGTEVVIYGQVRRCEVVVTQDGLRIDFDLWKSKVKRRE